MANTIRIRNTRQQVDEIHPIPEIVHENLLIDLYQLITETCSVIKVTIDAGLTLLNWRISVRIRQKILGGVHDWYYV